MAQWSIFQKQKPCILQEPANFTPRKCHIEELVPFPENLVPIRHIFRKDISHFVKNTHEVILAYSSH